jgi:hypothetical protein
MSIFNKTEYHNNNPEQGISVMQDVRDGKSHSNTYLKQVDKRNQIHTQDPRLTTTRRVVANSPIPSRELQETMDGEADAYAELEIEYDVEGDDVAYEAEMARRDLVKRLREVEKEFQDAKQEKQQLRLIEKTGKTDVEARQKLQRTHSPDTKHFDAFALAMKKYNEDTSDEDTSDNEDTSVSELFIQLMLPTREIAYNLVRDRDQEGDYGTIDLSQYYDTDELDTLMASEEEGHEEDYYGTTAEHLAQYYCDDTEEESNNLMAGGVASEEDMEEFYREQRERMEDADERMHGEIENRTENAMDDDDY